MSLDRLEALPSEAALVSRALQLLPEHRFWAGIVFLGPEDALDPTELPKAHVGPGHVRFKIRMDIDDVTRTNKIRDRWAGLEVVGVARQTLSPVLDCSDKGVVRRAQGILGGV